MKIEFSLDENGTRVKIDLDWKEAQELKKAIDLGMSQMNTYSETQTARNFLRIMDKVKIQG